MRDAEFRLLGDGHRAKHPGHGGPLRQQWRRHLRDEHAVLPRVPTACNPARGCWAWASATTSGAWHFSGDPDYDYACVVTQVTGTVIADKIGNVTGWAGRAWNWVASRRLTFGYPQAAPFNGTVIQQTASVDWYNMDFTAGGQVSKIIGSDLTGGSSGGGWFLSWGAAPSSPTPTAAGPPIRSGGNTGPISTA